MEMKLILENEIQRKKELVVEEEDGSSYGTGSEEGEEFDKNGSQGVEQEEQKANPFTPTPDGPVFADFSDSDDEGAELTRNSDFYKADELDIDQKKMRGAEVMGGVLNIDQQRAN